MFVAGVTKETYATSQAAAEAMPERTAESLRRQIHDALLAIGETGYTDEEMQIGLGIKGNTQRPRRRELQEMGLVYPTDQTRPTLSGRKAVVWVGVAA
jgi:hypothetical protein